MAKESRPLGLALVRPMEIMGAEPYFHELIAGIEDVTLPNGFSVLLLVLPSHLEEADVYRTWAEHHLVHGVFLVDLEIGDMRPELTSELGLPAVVVGPPDAVRHMTVWTDDDAAMTRAVQYLADLGHRVILHVGGPKRMRHSAARRSAFHQACRDLDLEAHAASGDYSRASGERAVREALDTRAGVTAAIFDSDLMALGGLDAAQDLNVSVPNELSLLSWDDSTQAQLSQPSLSALARNARALGRQVGQAMLDVLDGGSPDVRHAGPAAIIARESTGRRDAPVT